MQYSLQMETGAEIFMRPEPNVCDIHEAVRRMFIYSYMWKAKGDILLFMAHDETIFMFIKRGARQCMSSDIYELLQQMFW
jgi:hypothetical protein